MSEATDMFIKDWKKEIFTIPNMLSLFRLVLIPVYIVIYLNAENATDYYIAGGILAVSCLTDLIDGQIARRFNMITNLGKFLDPLADKLTQFALILCLALRYDFLWFVVGLFFIKESFQLIAGGCRLLRKGTMLKGALFSGKICTTILFISLIVLVLFPTIPVTAVKIIAAVDSVFLIIAFVDYLSAYISRASKFQAVNLHKDNNEPRS